MKIEINEIQLKNLMIFLNRTSKAGLESQEVPPMAELVIILNNAFNECNKLENTRQLKKDDKIDKT
jgi:hypothetical protein